MTVPSTESSEEKLVEDNTAHDALLQRLFSAIDRKDTAATLACIDSRARFRFGSAPAVTGHAEIGAAIDGFYDTIAGLSHVVDRILDQGEVLVCEGRVTYTRHDGSTVTLPFANIFDLSDGLIMDYRIYVDIAPLYAAV